MAQAARKARTSSVTLHIPVPAELAHRLEARARAEGVGVADVARELLGIRVTTRKKAKPRQLSVAAETRRRIKILGEIKELAFSSSRRSRAFPATRPSARARGAA